MTGNVGTMTLAIRLLVLSCGLLLTSCGTGYRPSWHTDYQPPGPDLYRMVPR